MDLEDRQFGAIAILGLGFALIIPVVTLLGTLIVTAWAVMLGTHNVHATFWGWLSDHHTNARGQTVWSVASWIWQYYVVIVSTYIAYQLCEFLAFLFGGFKRALA